MPIVECAGILLKDYHFQKESTGIFFGIFHGIFLRKVIKMRQCPYCGRWFKNKQALRAHLKRCPLKNKAIEIKTIKKDLEPMEKLLLKYLLFLCSLDRVPESFRISELKRALGWEEDTIYKFIDWLMNSEYRVIVRHIRIAKEAMAKDKNATGTSLLPYKLQ